MQILKNRKDLYNYITTHIHRTSEEVDCDGRIVLYTDLYEWLDGSIHDEPEYEKTKEYDREKDFEKFSTNLLKAVSCSIAEANDPEGVDVDLSDLEENNNSLEALGWTSDCE